MKQLLILACLIFGVVILGQKAYRIVVLEQSEAATGISLQSDNDSHAESSVKEYWQKGVDAVKDFFAGKSVWTIILLVVVVIVGVMLCLSIGFILLYFSIRCLVNFILFIADIFD